MNSTLLAQIASMTGQPLDVAEAETCYWRTGAGSLELHTRQSPVSRVASIACGVALHQAHIVLAANGFGSVVRTAGDQADLFAVVTPSGQHSPTAHDLAMYQVLKQSPVPEPAGHYPGTAQSISVLISDAVWPLGVRVHVLDDNTARFLDAMSHKPARVKAVCLALVTGTDSPGDWVRAGQALSAALLTARLAAVTAKLDDLLELPGRRALVRSLVMPALQPQILLTLTGLTPLSR